MLPFFLLLLLFLNASCDVVLLSMLSLTIFDDDAVPHPSSLSLGEPLLSSLERCIMSVSSISASALAMPSHLLFACDAASPPPRSELRQAARTRSSYLDEKKMSRGV